MYWFSLTIKLPMGVTHKVWNATLKSKINISYAVIGFRTKNISISGAVFMKGLSQVLGLSWLYFYTKVKPKTWLRPFVNTAPGLYDKCILC